MILLEQLHTKLQYQAKIFAWLLEIPELIAAGLFARGVYNFANFSAAEQSLRHEYSKNNLHAIFEHDTLKYIFIGEVDDDELIDELHKEIEVMSARILSLNLIEKPQLQIISAIYKSMGLLDESRFIVNTGAEFQLNWKPYFSTLTDPTEVLYADLLVHTRTFRLVASKYPLSKLSYDNISTYLSRRLKQDSNLHKATLGAERNKIEKHKNWLQNNLKSAFGDVLQNGSETPAFYHIRRKRYLVFGFMLPTEKAKKINTELPKLNLLVKNTKEFQKYIIKVEQQSLVFEAHRISTSYANHEVLTDMQIEQKKILMSHTDASNDWFALKGTRFSVGFRPIKVKEAV
ncbi:MAG: hypothetical protein COA35_006460 [Colwellia sp.]|jgi:hypothetical protein|nr:hypothetical protein [Pseudoalteromonas sp. BSi20480]MBL1384318.1 hypothetical protein [Colwellia sp.]GAA74840.1 hypothetical protein P20480_1304 [Pseudoalteromonas sp. BSi20480]|tara:strand:- start:6154 stop:7188 length:1035 start_codon:yes stop_codon:yes gene_type:complete